MGEFNKNRRLAFLPSGNHLYLHFLVLIHWIVVLGNLGAIVVLPILCLTGEVAWYIVFPLMTWLSVSACTRIECPFTRYENSVRKKIGKPPTGGGFIKHYFFTPYVIEPKKKKIRAKRKKNL
jgi:hypothetical protein